MPTNSFKNSIITIIFILVLSIPIFAQDISSTSNRGYIEQKEIPEFRKGTLIFGKGEVDHSIEQPQNLSELQKIARQYRQKGLEFQNVGNSDEATTFYQKAIELDPSYAIAYNDLGIIYEVRGFIDQAEASYLQAIKVNPRYLSPYSNLALLYENKRDLSKAIFYWEKRVELGSPDDPWTQKAKGRLGDIQLVLEKKPLQSSREQEIVNLIKDVSAQKAILRQDDKALAKAHFEKARRSFAREDYTVALKEAMEVMQLDPANTEIEDFIRKVHARMLQ